MKTNLGNDKEKEEKHRLALNNKNSCSFDLLDMLKYTHMQ